MVPSRDALILIVVAALTAAAAFASPALACECERNPTAAGILKQSSMVFSGVARSTVAAGADSAVTTFQVTERFKGAATKVVTVRHPKGPSASCGVQFEPGESYTLAAQRNANDYTTSLCSTWMFMPHVGLRDRLIDEMRALTKPRR